MNEKVGIYVRVSTEEQAKEGISIDAQIDRCKAFCKAKGWSIYQIYTDAGASAGSLKRPALGNLLEDARAKKFNLLLVYKTDRFSRNLKDLLFSLEELKKHGVHFTSVTEPIDTTSAMGEAFFQIIGVFAQLERGMVKERVNMAFDKKIDSGEVLNRAPLGYTYKNGKLTVNAEDAEKIRQIFEMHLAGVNYKEICSKFGLPISTFYEIIKNPTYIGKVQYRGQLYQGTHKAIIEEDLFYKINGRY